LIAAIVGAAVVLVIGCCTGLYIIGSQESPDASAPATSAPAGVVRSAPAVTSEPAAAAAETSAPAVEVSSSPAVKTVTMPKVTGQNAAVADDKLRKLGFTNVTYGSQDENDTVVLLLANWTVTKQSAKAGSKVRTDTLIVLTCTKQG
jgi:hypothetical protein